MSCGLRLIEFVGIRGPEWKPVPTGSWLKSYDPDAYDGRGSATWTFDTEAAMACWRTVSTVRPTRPDGQPNRPLTAATIECVELP